MFKHGTQGGYGGFRLNDDQAIAAGQITKIKDAAGMRCPGRQIIAQSGMRIMNQETPIDRAGKFQNLSRPRQRGLLHFESQDLALRADAMGEEQVVVTVPNGGLYG